MRKQFVINGMLGVLVVLIASCTDDFWNTRQLQESNVPFKNGTKLSYVEKKTMVGYNITKGESVMIGGHGLIEERNKVELYLDSKKEMYQINTTRLNDGIDNTNGLKKPIWKSKIENNCATMSFDCAGSLISSVDKPLDDKHYVDILLKTCDERAIELKDRIFSNTTKSNDYEVEVVQEDSMVVKLTKFYYSSDEIEDGMVGYKAISYINLKYGVQVISELYDSKGNLEGKTLLLYKIIDNIPILSFEQGISYITNDFGERVEYKTIIHYENITLTNY